jgi:hypothetical protein
MNHEQAMKDQASERYLLGELPENERDAFEEHYFECMMCADEVKSAFAFKDAVRASRAVHDEVAARRAARKAKWNLAPPLAAAASVLVAMLAWMQFGVVRPQAMQIAEIGKPRVLTAYRLESTRGQDAFSLAPPNSHEPFQLEVLVPPDGGAKYSCLVVDAHGVTRYTLFVAAAQTQDYVRIEIPAGALTPGDYTLRVDGLTPKIAEYPFKVR